MNTPNLTLMGYIWPAHSAMSWLRAVVLAVAGSLLIAAAAQIQVPMLPVPMTLQTLAVLALGGAYGARLGAATAALYVAEGAMGLPVYAGLKGGLAVLMGPTGGYLIGFVLAAAVVGYLAQKSWDRNAFTTFAAMLIGAALIYVPGLAWLYTYMGSVNGTLAAGFTPFVLADVIKAMLAAVAFPATWLAIDRH